MTKSEALRALRKVLADLYPTQNDSERIAEDAHLNKAFITFSAQATNNWYNVLQEAEKRDKVDRLLQIVNDENSDTPAFQKAYQDYLAATAQPDQPETIPTVGVRWVEPRHIKILFVAANPLDTDALKLDEEVRAIDLALQQGTFRDRFDLKQHWAVRYSDLPGLFMRHQPDIVHFSGHGSDTSEIILQDNTGASHPISVRALSTLFSVLKDNIRCVVLNACYSEPQAQAVAQHIDAVVGMTTAIGDEAAISFATAFYQGLGFGRNVKTAFDLGCNRIDLANLNEQDTPKLLHAPTSDPAQLVFTKTA